MINTILNQPPNQIVIVLTRKQKWLYYLLGALVLPAHFVFYALFYFVNFNTLIQYIIILATNNGNFNKHGFIYYDQIDFTLQVLLFIFYLILLFIFGIRGRKNKKYKFLFLGMLSAPLLILIVMTVVLAMSGPFLF